MRLLRILLVDLWNLEVGQNVEDFLDLNGIVTAVVILQNRPLRRTRPYQCLRNRPCTLPILDIAANLLAKTVQCPKAVKIVVVVLVVATQRDGNLAGLLDRLGRGSPSQIEAQENGRIDGVKGGFALSDTFTFGDGKVALGPPCRAER